MGNLRMVSIINLHGIERRDKGHMESSLLTKKKVYRLDGVDAIVKYTTGQKEYLYMEEVTDQYDNIIYKLEYNKEGQPEIQIDALYKGEKIIQQKVTNLFEETDETIDFEYDENQRLLREYIHYTNERVLHQSYEYDQTGNLTTIIYYHDGEEHSRDCSSYDDKGNNIIREQYDKDGELLEAETFEYNDNGEIIKIMFAYSEYDEQIDEYKHHKKTRLNKYDQNNRLISEVYLDENYSLNYTYDEKGRVSETSRFENERVVERHIKKYDTDDHIIEEKFISDIDNTSSSSFSAYYGGSAERNESYLLRYEYDNI